MRIVTIFWNSTLLVVQLTWEKNSKQDLIFSSGEPARQAIGKNEVEVLKILRRA